MSTTRQHLIETHTREGEHAVARSKFHKTMSGHFSKLAAMHDDDADQATLYQSIADGHSGMTTECTDQAAYHTDCAKSLAQTQKAAGMDGDRFADIVPDGIQGVIKQFSNNVMVPRVGAPTAPEAPNVPQEFQDLVKIE